MGHLGSYVHPGSMEILIVSIVGYQLTYDPNSFPVIFIWSSNKHAVLFCCQFFLQDPYGENVGIFDYVSLKKRLESIKKRLDTKKASGHVLEDSSSEEEEEVKTKESPPEIDDWEAFLYDDD